MMKFEQVRCYKQLATVIATGVVGGGYVAIKGLSGSFIGGVEWMTDTTKCVLIPATSDYFKTYLEEGEQLYGKGGSVTYPNEFSTYYVMHLNDEPSSQNNAPINFSGSISLSQN